MQRRGGEKSSEESGYATRVRRVWVLATCLSDDSGDGQHHEQQELHMVPVVLHRSMAPTATCCFPKVRVSRNLVREWYSSLYKQA